MSTSEGIRTQTRTQRQDASQQRQESRGTTYAAPNQNPNPHIGDEKGFPETQNTAKPFKVDEGNDPITVGELNNNQNNYSVPSNQTEKAPPKISPEKLKDPDFGKYDDDKQKISDGDIIDYMMKEWLLEGASWVMNKAGGLMGAFNYELLHGLSKGAKSGGRTISRATRVAFDKFHKHENPDTVTWDKIIDSHNQNIGFLTKNVENYGNPDTYNLNDALTEIGKGYILRKDDGTYYRVNEPDKPLPNLHLSAKQYNDIKQMAAEIHLAAMADELKVDRKALIDQYELISTYKAFEQANNGQAIPADIEAKYQELEQNKPEVITAFNNARSQFDNLQDGNLMKAKCFIDSKAELFAQYYAQLHLNNKHHENPDIKGKRLVDLNRKLYLEGYGKFMLLQQARLNGKTNLPSDEYALEEMQRLCQESFNQPTADTLSDQLTKKKLDTTQEFTMQDCADNVSALDKIFSNNISSLDGEIAAINAEIADCNSRRENVDKLKAKLTNRQEQSERYTKINNMFNSNSRS